jgi:hypothetical protein
MYFFTDFVSAQCALHCDSRPRLQFQFVSSSRFVYLVLFLLILICNFDVLLQVRRSPFLLGLVQVMLTEYISPLLCWY